MSNPGSNESDGNIVRELLKARVAEKEKLNSELYERLLLQIALFVVNLNMNEAADAQTMSQLSYDLSGFFDGYQRKEIELDVPGYILIYQILQLPMQIGRYKAGTSTDLKSFESKLIEQTPGPFVLRDGKMMNTCLRCCLDWCLRQLKTSFQLPKDWETLRQKSIDKGWSDFVALFWFLWTQWHQSKNEDRSQTGWYEDREMVMGLSTTELLGDMSSLILSVTPKRSRAGPQQDVGVDFQQRIVQGAQILSRQSDKELAVKFLRHCFQGDSWIYPKDGSHHLEILATATRVFLLGRAVTLDGAPSNQYTVVRTGGLDEAIATSYSTSTLSSMARQAASRWRSLTHSLSSRWLKGSRDADTKELIRRVDALSLNNRGIIEEEVETKHWIEAFWEEPEGMEEVVIGTYR